MCVIIDANIAGQVFDSPPSPDFAPVLKWLLRQKGMMVCGGRNARELFKVRRAADLIQELQRAGKAHWHPDEVVDAEEERVRETAALRSDDPHVIALARVSLARTLCSHDKELQQDFKDAQLVSKPRGKVYRGASNVNVLTHTGGCPGSKRK